MPGDLVPGGIRREIVVFIRRMAVGLAVMVALLVGAGFGLRWVLTWQQKSLDKIMARVKESDLLSKSIEDLKAEHRRLIRDLGNIDVYLNRGIEWSQKLVQISRIIPEEVWLTKLSFKKGHNGDKENDLLSIKAGLVSSPNVGAADGNRPPIGLLSRFVNKLKRDREFFSDFDDLSIAEARGAKKDGIDIMALELRLSIKDK